MSPRTVLASAFGASLVLAMATFAACSSDDSNSSPKPDAATDGTLIDIDARPPPTQESSCRDYIVAYCAKSDECRGRTTPSNCADTAELCPEYFFLPGSTRTIDSMLECADAWRTMTCEEFLAGVHPACQTPGTIKAGDPCVTAPQCETLFCVGPTPTSCGHCASFYPADAPCRTGDPQFVCPLNEVCDPATQKCSPIKVIPLGNAGAPCGTGSPACEVGLVCMSNVGGDAAAGTCQPLPGPGAPCALTVGNSIAACDPKTAHCAFSNPERTAGTCSPLPTAGQSCGLDTLVCDPQFYCRATTCAAYPAPGEACGFIDASTVQCKDALCAPRNGEDGGAMVCHQPPAGRNGDCSDPLSSCKSTLACRDGKCVAPGYPTCSAGDGGTDAATDH